MPPRGMSPGPSACAAPWKHGWRGRPLRVRPAREHSSQGLGAELQKDGEPFPFTDPTFRNLAVHRGYF